MMTWLWLRRHRRHGPATLISRARAARGRSVVVIVRCEVWDCPCGQQRWVRDLDIDHPPRLSGAPN